LALVSGGGALTPVVEKFFRSLGLVVIQGYGMTESTALITLNHPFHVVRGTIGKVMPGRDVKLGPDGEVLVKGKMISGATWSDGQLHEREDEWLSTGDLAEQLPTGELRFLGRKSEVIVTASGVNLHPEDLEAAFEEEPAIAGSAVVAMETPKGPEACAVLALRGDPGEVSAIIERANTRLAEFQRLRYWRLWPEPDLPRTSTGKVKRKVLTEWLAHSSTEKLSPNEPASYEKSNWLLTIIESITGESVAGGDELRLTEDLHLDSLGRVQLAAALEERLNVETNSSALDAAKTVGELRLLLSGTSALDSQDAESTSTQPFSHSAPIEPSLPSSSTTAEAPLHTSSIHHVYPHWPWFFPVRWIRASFTELIMRPLVWFLAAPKVKIENLPTPTDPVLIIANHVTEFDGALIEYALPYQLRYRIASAMSGEMLNDYRHFRNSEGHTTKFDLFGPLKYFLVTALFNVYPLPRVKNFQHSFAHAGVAMDSGYNVLIFPEGTRTRTGEMAHFRGGIGVLVKQSGAAVLPVALYGLAELKKQKRGWFRSGILEVRIGKFMRFTSTESEAAITEKLEQSVKRLLDER
jgi:long-chain acyl-CoA synthetase